MYLMECNKWLETHRRNSPVLLGNFTLRYAAGNFSQCLHVTQTDAPAFFVAATRRVLDVL
jgi:hypothetical protein